MHREQLGSTMEGKLPVFVFPSTLTFYTDDQTSHKQVLTLYNPYEFVSTFKVLCTSPKKYSVVDSEGTIKSRCCVDIVIRHKDIGMRNEGVKDKFRIQICEYGHKNVVGRKDVPAILIPTKDKSPPTEENFESLPAVAPSVSGSHSSQHSFATGRPRPPVVASSPSGVVILAAVLCIVALMLPLSGHDTSSLPEYLFLSVHQKLIAAYILGLVTMVVLRS